MALVENDIPEALGFIEQATNQMDSMLAALLELSRLGQGSLHPARVNVRDCVDDALWTLRDQIQEAGAQVEIGTLPVVVADRDALEMILLNLFSNAVKYRDESRPALIHVSAEKQVDCVVLSIADNGRGHCR